MKCLKRWLIYSKTLLCHVVETLSALLALREGNPPVDGGFISQGPVMRFDVFFVVSRKKLLNKYSGFELVIWDTMTSALKPKWRHFRFSGWEEYIFL